MKNQQKIKRVHLSLNEKDESILIGIVSADPDYKLSLNLNKKLGILLKSNSPVEPEHLTGSELLFSRFTDLTRAPDVVISLISNRSGRNFLLKNLKNIDYLLHVYDPENSWNKDQLIKSLRAINTITAVFSINIKSVKDKNLRYLMH